jgi:hypothetical protein
VALGAPGRVSVSLDCTRNSTERRSVIREGGTTEPLHQYYAERYPLSDLHFIHMAFRDLATLTVTWLIFNTQSYFCIFKYMHQTEKYTKCQCNDKSVTRKRK